MNDKTIPLANLIDLFLAKARSLNLVVARDEIYMKNHYYALLNVEEHHQLPAKEIPTNLHSITLLEIAQEIFLYLNGNQIEHLGTTKEQVTTRLIDELLPLPSTVEIKFNILVKEEGIKAATSWYYKFNKDSNYIKTIEIAKNQSWISQSKYCDLAITINLSKPEKDPHEIARQKYAKSEINEYPKCLLCIENEGYSGDAHKPCRYNHRMLKLNLNHEEWYFQYSPYLYYPEHSIIIKRKHQDMVINSSTFHNFFAFIRQFPHYIIGSNSDIPIVGGSILNHDHYQAGNHVFPIEHAAVKFNYKPPHFPNTTINYLNWPISTLQLVGPEKDLIELSELIINRWYHYNNPALNIVALSESGLRHNGITPILRKVGPDQYKMYLLLRNNRTTKEHPEGIFHPHKNLHHIKKENIGLIEAMGLAILPGRLANELIEIEKLLLLNDKNLALTELLFDKDLRKHELWLQEIYQKYGNFNPENIKEILKDEVAIKFCLVLEDSGVFKQNTEGDAAIKDFLNNLAY